MKALRRLKGSSSDAAGIGIVYHARVEIRIDLPVDGPLNHPVAELKCHNKALFRLPHIKLAVAAHAVGLIDKLVLKLNQVLLQVRGKPENIVSEPLVLPGLQVGLIQIFKVVNFRINIP